MVSISPNGMTLTCPSGPFSDSPHGFQWFNMMAIVSISPNGMALTCSFRKFSFPQCSVNACVNPSLSWFLPTHVYLLLSLLSLCQHHTFLPLTCLSPWPQTTAPSHHQSHMMSGTSSCAVGKDGKLLDANSSEPINTIPPLQVFRIYPYPSLFPQWPRP